MNERHYRRAVVVGLTAIGMPLVAALVAFATGSHAEPARAHAGSRCIIDAPYVRMQHMSYLKQQRDQVLRGGGRSSSLRIMGTCSHCHGAKSEFCDKCHNRASVQLDCFGCHQY